MRIFLGCLEKMFNILGDFLGEIIKNEGKIVLEARNTENVRLRRAKLKIPSNVGSKLTKFGLNRVRRARFFGAELFHFLKSKKYTAPTTSQAVVKVTWIALSILATHQSYFSRKYSPLVINKVR